MTTNHESIFHAFLNGLSEMDRNILLKINRTWVNSLFDVVFPFLTDFHTTVYFKYIFVPLFLLLLLWLRKKNGLYIFLGLTVSLMTTDYVGGKWIKPLFARLRPSVHGLEVLLKAPHFGGYSFTSNHAANIFCAAVFLSYFFPRWRFVLYLYAFIVAYSRIYVGVHYPLDVLFGALLGSFVGFLFSRILGRFIKTDPIFLNKQKILAQLKKIRKRKLQ